MEYVFSRVRNTLNISQIGDIIYEHASTHSIHLNYLSMANQFQTKITSIKNFSLTHEGNIFLFCLLYLVFCFTLICL